MNQKKINKRVAIGKSFSLVTVHYYVLYFQSHLHFHLHFVLPSYNQQKLLLPSYSKNQLLKPTVKTILVLTIGTESSKSQVLKRK